MAALANGDESETVSKLYDVVAANIDKLQDLSFHESQELVSASIDKVTLALDMVNSLQLFSDNEDIQDVATSEIRFLCLPAFLAFLTNRKEHADRLEAITKSKFFYLDFLKLCKHYHLTDIDICVLENGKKEIEVESPSNHAQREKREEKRTRKIEKFKKQKERKLRIEELEKICKSENVDEDDKREYRLSQLDQWIDVALEDIESFDLELEILTSKAKDENKTSPKKPVQPVQSLKPFILTKNKMQASVFGAGYPSVPTYSVEEFYERQFVLGRVPAAQDSAKHTEEEVDSNSEEEEEDVNKARLWDDWKDTHRRGWGNRQNRS